MKSKLIALSQRYTTALRKHLRQGPQASLQPARGLGRQAVAIGLVTLDVARIHKGLQKEIVSTLRLVDMSVRSIGQFVREYGKHHEA